jgi:hypothetical protein
MPTSYCVHQELEKWRPRINRISAFGEGRADPKVDWDWIDASRLGSVRYGREVRRRLLDGDHRNRELRVLRASDVRNETGSAGFWGSDPRGAAATLAAARAFACTVSGTGPGSRGRLLSEVSPCFAAGTGDLSVIDPDDEGQWLVMVIVRTEDGFAVYRRVFGGGQ